MEFFEHTFEDGGLHLKYARSAPAVRDREMHDYFEFVFFCGGKARFVSKGIQCDLSPGSILFIPKNAFHRFDVEGSDYTRCILSFYETPALSSLLSALGGEVCLIESPSGALSLLADGVMDAACSDADREEKSLYLYAAIVHLLFECRKSAGNAVRQGLGASGLLQEVLKQIDDGYSSRLSVQEIASALHVSESLLSHAFKKEMGISVYKYISKKRLSVARDLIASGLPITAAAVQSGFSDYTCFLRMYKAEYGCAPSQVRIPAKEHPFP